MSLSLHSRAGASAPDAWRRHTRSHPSNGLAGAKPPYFRPRTGGKCWNNCAERRCRRALYGRRSVSSALNLHTLPGFPEGGKAAQVPFQRGHPQTTAGQTYCRKIPGSSLKSRGTVQASQFDSRNLQNIASRDDCRQIPRATGGGYTVPHWMPARKRGFGAELKQGTPRCRDSARPA
jgi:hypothetical protein